VIKMIKSLRLGDLCVTGLTEIESFSIPVGTLFPDLNHNLLAKLEPIEPRIMSEGLVHLTIRSWLLNKSGTNILIDSCVGAQKNRPNHSTWHKRSGSKWLRALSEKGLRPEDIDIVMCTHLHADHVGWNTRLENGYWVPTFPNAQYLCGRTEYEYWAHTAETSDKHGAFADSVLPIVENGKMKFVEDSDEIANGLSIGMSPGHTPGHLCLHADAGAIFCGDIIHSPLQLNFPNISSAFCEDPVLAHTTRIKLLSKIAETGQFLIPAHFRDPGWTKIKKTELGYEKI